MSEVKVVVNKIKSGRLAQSLKTNRDHARHVKSIVEKKSGISCPKCGMSMVMREVKKGENMGDKFWGCASFPKCRGVVNVE